MKQHKKQVFLIIWFVLACILAFVALDCIPYKMAVSNLTEAGNESYILVKQERTTGFEWGTVGGHRLHYVKLTGKVPPSNKQLNIEQSSDIVYICHGNEVGTYFDDAEYFVYDVTDWEVQTPIQEESIFRIPHDGYFSLYDFLISTANGYNAW